MSFGKRVRGAWAAQVDLEVEEFHWVPKDAIKHMMALLGQFKELPTAPFMSLLGELNKVWKQRETERIREVQLQHEQDLADFRRLHQQATPYQQSVMQNKLDYLRRELKSSRAHHYLVVLSARNVLEFGGWYAWQWMEGSGRRHCQQQAYDAVTQRRGVRPRGPYCILDD